MVTAAFAGDIYNQTWITSKIIVFWDVMLLDLVGRYQCFGGTCCPHFQGRQIVTSCFSEILIPVYQTTGHHMRTSQLTLIQWNLGLWLILRTLHFYDFSESTVFT
jgi:hypothetical protein